MRFRLCALAFSIGFLLLPKRAEADGTDSPTRLRLTETSVTESGRFSGTPHLKVQTKGYGFTYISPYGVGASYTSLVTAGRSSAEGGPVEVRAEHRYVDLGYTLGFFDQRLLLTGGGGLGVSGKATAEAAGVKSALGMQDGKCLFLGPGFSIGFFEVYWIHRRNWVRFAGDGFTSNLASSHYQLGLGAHF